MDESLARGELSLRQLAHFVAVAEDGTISGAAERLIMSSSALSASITELERALGADLLVRRRAQGVSSRPWASWCSARPDGCYPTGRS